MGGVNPWGAHLLLWQNEPALPQQREESWISPYLNLLLYQVSHSRCKYLEFYPDSSLMCHHHKTLVINEGEGGMALLQERSPINFLPSTPLFYCILSLRLWKWTFECSWLLLWQGCWWCANCNRRAGPVPSRTLALNGTEQMLMVPVITALIHWSSGTAGESPAGLHPNSSPCE